MLVADEEIFSMDGCSINCFCFPDTYNVEDIVFDSCLDQEKDELNFIILATNNCCCSSLLKWNIKPCGIKLCTCNYTCHCNCCESECDETKCINDIIESIALVETALSHILNAEGEKLQKAVEIATNVCELLEIDESVNKTITNIIQLEHILYSKLELINTLDCKKCHNKKSNLDHSLN